MDGQRRRELTESSQLAVHEEQWFLVDLVLAVVGFVGWVAVTGALTALGAREAGITIAIEPGSTQTRAILAGAVVGWILVPALAAAFRVRDRITNVSGNVEKRYRFEYPGTLLWPAIPLLVVAAVVALVSPLKWPAFALAFVAGAHLLVRAGAFSYRVFAVSYPSLVHVTSFLTFALYATTGVIQLAAVVGERGMVRDAVGVLGVPIDVYGTVGPGGFAVPTVQAIAATTPVVLVAGYLVIQSLVAAYVRRVEPTVDRGSLRAGQRNPFQPAIPNGAGGQIRQSTQQPTGQPASDEDDSVPVHVQTTRVYDPEDEVADRAGINTGSTSRGGQQCRTCNASFRPGTEVRFCPNCGQRLDDG